VVVSAPQEWDGRDYQARFDALAAEGVEVHGEVRFLLAFSPTHVLDAGCGTGRVAIELDRRGVEAVGVDLDPSMLATARALAPHLRFEEADLADPTFSLGRAFDLVVMAGNVPLFTPPGTQGALVAGCARHLSPDGLLVAGFSLDRGYDLAAYDSHCRTAGLTLVERWSTWDRVPLKAQGPSGPAERKTQGPSGPAEPATPDPSYAVSVHRRPP